MVKRPTGSGGEPSSPNRGVSAGGKARQLLFLLWRAQGLVPVPVFRRGRHIARLFLFLPPTFRFFSVHRPWARWMSAFSHVFLRLWAVPRQAGGRAHFVASLHPSFPFSLVPPCLPAGLHTWTFAPIATTAFCRFVRLPVRPPEPLPRPRRSPHLAMKPARPGRTMPPPAPPATR